MSDARPKEPLEENRDRAERVLRAKYLDYCSSQIAGHLVLLSPDEIYVLAREAHRAGGRDSEPSYEQMVRLATEGVAQRLTLPTFEQWSEEYAQDPARYDEQLLGLWESELEEAPDPEADPDPN
ncbi:MAG TPA: hypothetical protein DCE19_09160 [Gemmatimonadetes bacterium]|nr:hypothetical protein [Gemmatimonadota bacterium]|tara:strand:+ start:267 stop:638 length:372 start_codon:yes stop_codon:yes gene_type:complete